MDLNELEIEGVCLVRNHIQSLTFIYQIIKDEREKIIELTQKSECEYYFELVGKIRQITSEVYSACEVINQMMISIYRNNDRYRGTQLKRGFNDNFKTVYNAAIKKTINLEGIYKDKFVSSFFSSARTWYIQIHDIRTQETHYEVGKLKQDEDKIYYFNGNRNGVSKMLYSNPSNEINIEINEFIKLIDAFISTEESICKLINRYYVQPQSIQ